MALAYRVARCRRGGRKRRLIDLRDYELAFAMGEHHANVSASLDRLRAEVRAAHGILIGTPEYHGSFSGVLKNALDLMGFDEFEGKMIGLGRRFSGPHGRFRCTEFPSKCWPGACMPGLFPSRSPSPRHGRFSMKAGGFTILRSNRGCSRLAGASQSSLGYTNVEGLRSSSSRGKARWKILVAELARSAS